MGINLSRSLLFVYLAILIWVVLFKLKVDISSILDHKQRILNLKPFGAPARTNGRVDYHEMIFNCLFFVPFGLLLSVNFKKMGFLPKLALIFAFSLTVELIQFIFGIGSADITDLIMNTFGGLLGLLIYGISSNFIQSILLDKLIVYAGMVLLVIFLVLRSQVTLR
jgi:glycopeptide antibiotics resistance protein